MVCCQGALERPGRGPAIYIYYIYIYIYIYVEQWAVIWRFHHSNHCYKVMFETPGLQT